MDVGEAVGDGARSWNFIARYLTGAFTKLLADRLVDGDGVCGGWLGDCVSVGGAAAGGCVCSVAKNEGVGLADCSVVDGDGSGDLVGYLLWN